MTGRAAGNAGLALKFGEALPEGLRRVLHEQLDGAVEHLSTAGAERGKAIHEARKSIKRTRSLLRLIRPAINAQYKDGNRTLRAAGRMLSEMRDAQVLIDTLHDLQAAQNRAFAGIEKILAERKARIESEV